MLIRQETPADRVAVEALVRAAFATAACSDGQEHALVARLRQSTAFIPELSLVAEQNGELAGYALFTKARVGVRTVLALAPLAVLPAYQKQGIGTALLRAGHRAAQALGYEYVLVLGSEHYYPRFGYRPAAACGVEVPAGFPPANFMVLRLREDAAPLQGAVTYAEEFSL